MQNAPLLESGVCLVKSINTALILVAMRKEFYHKDYNDITYYTGVGKVNATIAAMKLVTNSYFKPKCIINIGTVGALNPAMSGLYECGQFKDRDLPSEFDQGTIINNPNQYTCATGDTFLKSSEGLDADFVDMESFAIASVCRQYGVKFLCYKFVTDYVNKESLNDWENNIEKGNSLFKEKLDDYFSNAV